jgi:hypothetical protein
VSARVIDLGAWNGKPIVLGPDGQLLPSAAAVSSDGRYVLDAATATRIDRQTGERLEYDTDADGALLTGFAEPAGAALSADGRYVAFGEGSNADPESPDGCFPWCTIVYRKDLLTGALERVDVGDWNSWPSNSPQRPSLSISDDGMRVAFPSRRTLPAQHAGSSGPFGYVRDFGTGTTTMVTGTEYFPYAMGDADQDVVMSGDGKTVSFVGGFDSVLYMASADARAATHSLTGLVAVPADQTITDETAAAHVAFRASFDDGADLAVPGGALRFLNPPDHLTPILVTRTPDGVDVAAPGAGPLVFTFGLWDDSGITADARIDFERRATVTARDQVTTYGSSDPSFTYALSNVRPAELTQAPNCAPPTPHTDAGQYPIHCSGAAARNYVFDYVDGTLTVNPAQTSLVIAPLSGNTVSGTLTFGSAHTPVSGQPITFTRRGTALCTATTDAGGRGACKLSLANELAVFLGGGHYQAAFAGSRNLLPSDASR